MCNNHSIEEESQKLLKIFIESNKQIKKPEPHASIHEPRVSARKNCFGDDIMVEPVGKRNVVISDQRIKQVSNRDKKHVLARSVGNNESRLIKIGEPAVM